MAAEELCFEDFPGLVRHEIGRIARADISRRQIDRIDFDRMEQLSVIFILLRDEEKEGVRDFLAQTLRESDLFSIKGNHLYLLLPMTDREGALHILGELSELLGRTVPEIIVTYPEEASDALQLLEKMHDYAQMRYGLKLDELLLPA